MNFADLVNQYGGWAFLLWFLYQQIWPWLRDKVWPGAQESRRTERDQVERLISNYQSMYERITNQLYLVVQENTRAWVGLQGTLENVSAQLVQQNQMLADLNEDIAEIYGRAGKARPSRTRRRGDLDAP
jgi:predicted sugar kinase